MVDNIIVIIIAHIIFSNGSAWKGKKDDLLEQLMQKRNGVSLAIHLRSIKTPILCQVHFENGPVRALNAIYI